MTGHWAGRALVEAEIPFPAVAQTVRFGLGRSKMLCLSMGIDRLPLRRWTVRLCIGSFKAMARQLALKLAGNAAAPQSCTNNQVKQVG
jgi:hypothetical protein